VRIAFQIQPRTLAVIGLVGVAAALRLAFFNGLHFADDPDYAARAYSLLSGQGFLYPDNNGFRIGTWMPAALGYAVLGITHAGLVAYPFLVTLLGVVLAYALGRRLFDTRTGLTAAALYAFYPLDVELASRLLPDPLLAAFSLLAIYPLLSADLSILDAGHPRLWKRWPYVASGVALGWCTVVNMSAVSVGVFFVVYFPLSLAFFAWRFRDVPVASVFRAVCLPRYLWLTAGFLIVVALEASLYYVSFGDPFLKHAGTVSHYASAGPEFFRDLWHYPRRMFFVDRDWRVHALDDNGRVYGYYFVLALPALALGFARGGVRFAMVGSWLIVVWLFLQWGTMSFSRWNFLHRLDRHLELLTPALVLVIAYMLGQFRSRWGRWIVVPAAMVFLAVTSWHTMVARHRQLTSDVALMAPIHQLLELARPAHVYTDTQTIAYQRFLDRYEDRGRRYEPIETATEYQADRSLAILQTVSQLSILPSGVDAAHPPAHWIPFASFPGDSVGSGLEGRVRIYRITRPADQR
jgi:4-amino-4-deoxy-L-arabinose transferase-like glycosyltransferase